MHHVTKHYDATDIDKFNGNVTGKTNIVYHAKRRFPSPLQNMHYNKNFDAVGQATGNKEFDMMRFRTTQSEFHNAEKIRFGGHSLDPNPITVYEKMAKASRFRLMRDGRPRGLLAHEDFRSSVSLQPTGRELVDGGAKKATTVSVRQSLETSNQP